MDIKTSGNHTYEQASIGNSTDQTDKGPIWDIVKNFRGFWYDPSSGALSLALGAGTGGALEVSEGPSWLNFSGYWGDQKWPTTRPGQYCVQDECLINDGPTGKGAAPIQATCKQLSLTAPPYRPSVQELGARRPMPERRLVQRSNRSLMSECASLFRFLPSGGWRLRTHT